MDYKLFTPFTFYPEYNSLSINQDYKCIYAQVLFGSPNKNCAGAGICKTITPSEETKNVAPLLNCDHANVIILYRNPGVLHFFFELASMCPRTVKKHFDKRLFVIEAVFDFVPPNESFKFQIKPGVYPVEKMEKFLRVSFLG